jgi:hypothetical protein
VTYAVFGVLDEPELMENENSPENLDLNIGRFLPVAPLIVRSYG